MADKQPPAPTHRVYTVIKREGQDDYWLNIGLAFPHKDGKGFNVVLQALPLDGKSVDYLFSCLTVALRNTPNVRCLEEISIS